MTLLQGLKDPALSTLIQVSSNRMSFTAWKQETDKETNTFTMTSGGFMIVFK